MVNQKVNPDIRRQLAIDQGKALDSYIKDHKIRSFQDLALARDRTRQRLFETMADIFAPIPKSPHEWQPMKVICQPHVPGPAAAVVLPVNIVQTNPKRTNVKRV